MNDEHVKPENEEELDAAHVHEENKKLAHEAHQHENENPNLGKGRNPKHEDIGRR